MNRVAAFKKDARVQVKRSIKLGLAALSAWKPANSSVITDTVAVLMYHRVNAYRHDELSIPPEVFRKQLQWLSSQGFQNMRMRELESWPPDERLVGRRVIFTFDDGYADNYTEALPILQQFGYTGIFYLATDYIGNQRFYQRDMDETGDPTQNRLMDWEHIRQLLKAGMEVGSHTVSHTQLTQLSDDAVKHELTHSRRIIEEQLQQPITSFCFPEGAYQDRHIPLVRAAGYASACTTDQGFWRRHPLLTIPRIAVLASDGFFVFRQKITARMEWAFRLMH